MTIATQSDLIEHIGNNGAVALAQITDPTAGNAPGAVCVTAGTTGTWKNMASLSA